MYLVEKFKKIAKDYAESKAASAQAELKFVPIRDCYGVVDSIEKEKDGLFFTARIYTNSTNEFVEVINAPVDAFKKSDADLLNEGSVFYWKVGYRHTIKGSRVKVNEFTLRRIIREKSILRNKRVEKVVGDLMSIFE
ncbi:hypothetical protein NS381_03325 [Pantoea stewartii]|nr:hypothetical protein NS381_03325 [Pantoea stewartii]